MLKSKSEAVAKARHQIEDEIHLYGPQDYFLNSVLEKFFDSAVDMCIESLPKFMHRVDKGLPYQIGYNHSIKDSKENMEKLKL